MWPALRLKLLKNYIAELNVLFSLIFWSSLEPLNVYIYVYFLAMMLLFLAKFIIPSLKISIFIKYISGRCVERRGSPPNDKKVVVRGTLKSAIKSMHWKVALKQQVQSLFSI